MQAARLYKSTTYKWFTRNLPESYESMRCGVGRSCVAANGVIEANGHSKWGQIKIQDDPLLKARNAITKFCSDPFCVVSGASGLPCARRVPYRDLAAPAPDLHRVTLSLAGSELGPNSVDGPAFTWRMSQKCLPASLYALHIQELLPHHSKGLQACWYIKNTQKQYFSKFFLTSLVAKTDPRYINSHNLMYFIIFRLIFW